jgi:predicted dehydrogenase
VSAEAGNLVSNVEVEDLAAATLRFDNGAIGSLIAGAHVFGAEQEEFCQLYGTKGQIRLPDPYGSGPLQMYLKEPWGDFEADKWHEILLDPVHVYSFALEDFARAVQCGSPAPVDAESARHVLATVLSIYRSSAEKRTIPVL